MNMQDNTRDKEPERVGRIEIKDAADAKPVENDVDPEESGAVGVGEGEGLELDCGDGDTAGKIDGSEPPVERDPVAVLQGERDEIEGRLLRVSADYQNFVRRSHQNIEDARREELMRLAKALLTPLDHFDLALAVEPEKATADGVLEGVKIVRDELIKVLEQFGVQRLEVRAGDEFDPKKHEALLNQKAEGVEPGRVAAQLEPGYLLGDRTLRPAKVAVAE